MGIKTIKHIDLRVKVASKLQGLTVKSIKPSFNYKFEDTPIEMPQNHANKILKNDNFYISNKDIKKPEKVAENKPKQVKTWLEEINEIKNITKKELKDVIGNYPNREDLLKKLAKGEDLKVSKRISEILKKHFIH